MVDLSVRERAWIDALWEALPEQASTILGTEVSLGKIKFSEGVEEVGKKTYFSVLADDSGVGANLFFGVDECSAIAFAGLLVMMQEKVIKDKISRREMDEDDLDAMSECINQMTSVFNEVTKKTLESEVHLVFQSAGLKIPAELKRFEDTRVIVARSKIQVGQLHSGEMRVLIPEMLFSGKGLDDGGDDAMSLSEEEAAALREAAQEGAQEVGKVGLYLPLRRDEELWAGLFHESALESELAGCVHQLRRSCALGEISCILIDADACEHGGLPALARLLACQEVQVPVAVVASRPTRTHLIACLSAGSYTYLVKPMNADALRSSLEEILRSWDLRERAS